MVNSLFNALPTLVAVFLGFLLLVLPFPSAVLDATHGVLNTRLTEAVLSPVVAFTFVAAEMLPTIE